VTRRVAVLGLVLVTALLLDTVVLVGLAVRGVSPSLVVLTVIAVALAGGPEPGVRYGFIAGLTTDLLAGGLLGLFALVHLLTGYLTGLLRPFLGDGGLLVQLGVGAAASAGNVALYGALTMVLAQQAVTWPMLLLVAVVVGLGNGLLAPFVLRAVTALLRRAGARRDR
jgi:rod shape-determining protein MreD